jgi:hypothetical protein
MEGMILGIDVLCEVGTAVGVDGDTDGCIEGCKDGFLRG